MANSVLQNKGFVIHLTVYVLVNLLLVIINLTVAGEKLWFQWPLLGWGIGILGHGFAAWQKSKSTMPSP